MDPHRNPLAEHSKLHPLKHHQQLSKIRYYHPVEFGLTTYLCLHWVKRLVVNPIAQSAEQFVAPQNSSFAQSAANCVQSDAPAKLEVAQ